MPQEKRMYIAEVCYPGTWLELGDEDKDIAFEIENMLSHLVDLVGEAAVTLTLFEQTYETPRNFKEEFEQEAALRSEIDKQIRAEFGDPCYQDFDKFRLESDRRLRSRKANLGILPRTYLHKIPFIHAHSFVYAVDSFGKFLDELCEYEVIPAKMSELRDEFNARLPSVRKIRNSALHIEDRLRRYASWKDKKQGKRMDVDGFLGLSNLEGNKLCYTIDDGSYQRIEVNDSTLSVLVEIANKVLTLFDWKGPPRLEPAY